MEDETALFKALVLGSLIKVAVTNTGAKRPKAGRGAPCAPARGGRPQISPTGDRQKPASGRALPLMC